MVKKYKHGLQLCGHCYDAISFIGKYNSTVESNLELF